MPANTGRGMFFAFLAEMSHRLFKATSKVFVVYWCIWRGVQDAWQSLWPLRVNILFALILLVLLTIPDQSADILCAFAERFHWTALSSMTPVAFAWGLGWMFWWTSKSLLQSDSRHWHPRALGRQLRIYTPRLLAVWPMLVLGIGLCTARRLVVDPAATLRWRLEIGSAFCCGWGLLFWYVRVRIKGDGAKPQKKEPKPRWFSLTPDSIATILLSLAYASIIFGFAVQNPRVAREAGLRPLDVIFIAPSVWLILFCVIVRWVDRCRFPLISALLVLVVLVGKFDCNDNHAIRLLDSSVDPGRTIKIPSTTKAFCCWWDTRPDRDHYDEYPVFIVVTEGGGIRNAYWTALVLANLADSNPMFRHHVFAISGVSGGSVGAAVYAATVRLSERTSQRVDFRSIAAGVLSDDLLTPLLTCAALPEL